MQANSYSQPHLQKLEEKIGYSFKCKSLLQQSLIHCSSSTIKNNNRSNERLEFLGDSILGFVITELLFSRYEAKSEGDLSRFKSKLVSTEVLSSIALALELNNYIVLGKGEEISGGRKKKAILADSLEAVIAAIYLDSSIQSVFSFVTTHFSILINQLEDQNFYCDYKSILQEFTQKQFKIWPVYQLVKKTGPDHDKTFWILCKIGKKEFGPFCGKSKKEAEQQAADMAYKTISESN